MVTSTCPASADSTARSAVPGTSGRWSPPRTFAFAAAPTTAGLPWYDSVVSSVASARARRAGPIPVAVCSAALRSFWATGFASVLRWVSLVVNSMTRAATGCLSAW
ncbi:hypothetical protein [Streptacidiphilus sp. P02-A3a]|uniref:hypothetical protein n=1 Tax=Streptacidiphilus sp. P02-A3a TaxID=2704468 RepID=UPI001CDB886D|nr:hypothetical protein [Streptacidiphilus sp. P02-A3a]